MFNAEIIQSRLRQSPFVSMRIIISSGLTFDVYHPDLVLVGVREIMIGMASKRNPVFLSK